MSAASAQALASQPASALPHSMPAPMSEKEEEENFKRALRESQLEFEADRVCVWVTCGRWMSSRCGGWVSTFVYACLLILIKRAICICLTVGIHEPTLVSSLSPPPPTLRPQTRPNQTSSFPSRSCGGACGAMTTSSSHRHRRTQLFHPRAVSGGSAQRQS